MARVSVGSGRSVSAGNVEYLLANKLAPQGLVAGAGADRATARPDPMILALKLHRTLLPEAGVQVVARLLGPLFSPLVVVAVLGALAGADLWWWVGGDAGCVPRGAGPPAAAAGGAGLVAGVDGLP